jgi:HEAT repeat protein
LLCGILEGAQAFERNVDIMGSNTNGVALAMAVSLLLVGCTEKSKPKLPSVDSVPSDLRPFVAGLADKNSDMRWQAARELGLLGTSAAPAVPHLTAALQDQEPKVRLWSSLALAEIGPLAHDAVDDLEKLRETAEQEKNEELERAVKRALARIRGE